MRALAIFDLDGTLADTKLDLACAVNAMRAHMGLAAQEVELIRSYVGDGVPMLIRRSLGPEASEAQFQAGLDYFLPWYAQHALVNTRFYPGVMEALEQLHANGVAMAVVTNKPETVSREIVEGLGAARYFLRIYGGDSFPEKKPNPTGVENLLRESGVPRERAFFIGDSSVDVRTARNAGVRVFGVSYGFKPESFEQYPPDAIFDTMPAVAAHLVALLEAPAAGTGAQHG